MKTAGPSEIGTVVVVPFMVICETAVTTAEFLPSPRRASGDSSRAYTSEMPPPGGSINVPKSKTVAGPLLPVVTGTRAVPTTARTESGRSEKPTGSVSETRIADSGSGVLFVTPIR